jgi:hypothetical protein
METIKSVIDTLNRDVYSKREVEQILLSLGHEGVAAEPTVVFEIIKKVLAVTKDVLNAADMENAVDVAEYVDIDLSHDLKIELNVDDLKVADDVVSYLIENDFPDAEHVFECITGAVYQQS